MENEDELRRLQTRTSGNKKGKEKSARFVEFVQHCPIALALLRTKANDRKRKNLDEMHNTMILGLFTFW